MYLHFLFCILQKVRVVSCLHCDSRTKTCLLLFYITWGAQKKNRANFSSVPHVDWKNNNFSCSPEKKKWPSGFLYLSDALGFLGLSQTSLLDIYQLMNVINSHSSMTAKYPVKILRGSGPSQGAELLRWLNELNSWGYAHTHTCTNSGVECANGSGLLPGQDESGEACENAQHFCYAKSSEQTVWVYLCARVCLVRIISNFLQLYLSESNREFAWM